MIDIRLIWEEHDQPIEERSCCRSKTAAAPFQTSKNTETPYERLTIHLASLRCKHFHLQITTASFWCAYCCKAPFHPAQRNIMTHEKRTRLLRVLETSIVNPFLGSWPTEPKAFGEKHLFDNRLRSVPERHIYVSIFDPGTAAGKWVSCRFWFSLFLLSVRVSRCLILLGIQAFLFSRCDRNCYSIVCSCPPPTALDPWDSPPSGTILFSIFNYFFWLRKSWGTFDRFISYLALYYHRISGMSRIKW